MSSTQSRSAGTAARGSDGSDALLRIALPTGTPPEAEVAVRRLVELVATLARRAAQLQEALDSRVVIEQAKGVLAERYSLSPDEAFALLRRSARSNRMPLRQLAAAVVASPHTPAEIDDGVPQRRSLRPVAASRAAR
jgi:hypothetical protein